MSGSKKTFTIVGFIDEENCLEVIPTHWIKNSSEAKWPNVTSPSVISKYIKECKPVQDSWSTIKIRIYGYSNSLKKAKIKSGVIQRSLNDSSDSSEVEEIKPMRKRQKKSSHRRSDYVYSSEMDSSGSEEKHYRNKKHKKAVSSSSEVETPIIDEIYSTSKKRRKSHHQRDRRSSLPKNVHQTNDPTFLNSLQSFLNTVEEVESNIPEVEVVPSDLIEPLEEKKQFESSKKDSGPSAYYLLEQLQGKGALESSTNDSSPTTYFDQLFKYLELMHEEINELSLKFDAIEMQLKGLPKFKNIEDVIVEPRFESYNGDFTLPVKTDDELHELNERLKLSKELSRSIIKYLYDNTSGRTVGVFLGSVARKVMSKEIALSYTRFGRKGKKSFSRYPETMNIMLAATKLRFKHLTAEDLLDSFGKTLAGANDWMGGRKNRTRNVNVNVSAEKVSKDKSLIHQLVNSSTHELSKDSSLIHQLSKEVSAS